MTVSVVKKIDKTPCLAEVHFSDTGIQSVEDKLQQMPINLGCTLLLKRQNPVLHPVHLIRNPRNPHVVRDNDDAVITFVCKLREGSFDSDVEVGAPSRGGPPGYMSIQFHTKMARLNHLYKLFMTALSYNTQTHHLSYIRYNPIFDKKNLCECSK